MGLNGGTVPDFLSGDKSVQNFTAQRETFPWTVGRFTLKLVSLNRPFGIWIENGDIGIGILAEGAFGDIQEAGRSGCEAFHEERQITEFGVVKDLKGSGEGGFHSNDSKWGGIKFGILLVGGMRGVIGSDNIQTSIKDPIDDGLAIRLGTQGRVHFEIGIEILAGGVCEEKVMGSGLAGDADTAFAGAPNDIDAIGGRYMLVVNVGVQGFGKDHVTPDDDIFGGGGPALETEAKGPFAFMHDRALSHAGVLAMVHDEEIEHAGVFDGPPHDFVVLNAFAIVGDCDNALIGKGTDRRERFAVHSHREAAGGQDIHERGVFNGVADSADRSWIVGDGTGIGHTDNGGKSTRCRGAGSRADVLLVGLTGFPQMHVNIDQSGTDHLSGNVQNSGRFDFMGLERSNDFAAANVEIGKFIPVVGGIDNATVFKDQSGNHVTERQR